VISLTEFAKKLFNEKSVALIMHVRPDGDTIGSTLALTLALRSKGIKADAFSCEKIPEKYNFLPQISMVKDTICEEYSSVVAVDCADVLRTGNFADYFIKHKNSYVLDHHVSNELFAKTSYVNFLASNCENVLNIILETGVEITPEIADLLLLGVVTDTGAFAHKNVTEKTLDSAKKLVGYGGDLNKIIYHTFKKQTKQRADLFAKVMGKIRYFHDQRFAVISVFTADFNQTGATDSDTEGFVDFVMGVDTVEVGACVMEMAKNKYKISFRSKGPNVNEIAGLFGGGGHSLASGCQISGEYEEVIDKITFAVSKYLVD
jgi:phosphoesterase RecJ-like protein